MINKCFIGGNISSLRLYKADTISIKLEILPGKALKVHYPRHSYRMMRNNIDTTTYPSHPIPPPSSLVHVCDNSYFSFIYSFIDLELMAIYTYKL